MIDTKTMIDAKDGGSSRDGKTMLYLGENNDERWNFFAAGTGDFTSRRADITTGAITLGLDRRLCDHFVLGGAITYAHTSFDLDDGGDVGINSFLGSIYGEFYSGGFYLDGILSAGYHRYETHRATVTDFAQGDTDGRSIHGYLGGGYDCYLGGFIVGPIASLRYSYVETDSFTETDTATPIRVTSGSLDSLQSAIGLRVARPWQITNTITVTPEIRAQWAHEFLDNTGIINTGEPFTPLNAGLGRDSLLLDAGVWVRFTPRVSVFGFYRADVGRSNYTAHSISGGLQISF